MLNENLDNLIIFFILFLVIIFLLFYLCAVKGKVHIGLLKKVLGYYLEQ